MFKKSKKPKERVLISISHGSILLYPLICSIRPSTDLSYYTGSSNNTVAWHQSLHDFLHANPSHIIQPTPFPNILPITLFPLPDHNWFPLLSFFRIVVLLAPDPTGILPLKETVGTIEDMFSVPANFASLVHIGSQAQFVTVHCLHRREITNSTFLQVSQIILLVLAVLCVIARTLIRLHFKKL